MDGTAILQMLQKYDYRCALTGRQLTPDEWALDHKISIEDGGKIADINNLQPLRPEVNRAKHTMTNDTFVQMCREVVAWADRTK